MPPTSSLVGPNGVGKSTLAQNIAHQALIHGHTVLFTSAGQLLGDLCALDSDSALRRRLRHYAPPAAAGDRRGRLSLLFQPPCRPACSNWSRRRYQSKSTLITTNRPFAEWREVFPNAACVVSLIDRLVHNAEIIAIEGDSYRLKEAHDRAENSARVSAAEPNHERLAASSPLSIPFAIPAYWTPEQAMAVFELLDDLRERIWAHYQLQLIDLYREQYGSPHADPSDIADDDLPF